MIDRLKEVLRKHDAAVTNDTDNFFRKNAIMGLLRVQMDLR